MKFNGTIFSKPQQDQLKENIGKELEKATATKTYSLNLSTEEGRKDLIELSQVANQGKKVSLKRPGDTVIYTAEIVTANYVTFGGYPILNPVNNSITSYDLISIKCNTSSAKRISVRVPVSGGTNTQNSTDIGDVTLLIEA